MSSKFIVNSFQVPNALVDLLMAGLSGNALKCYLLVARQTTGWHKQMDYIPIAQFKQKCGIKKDETVSEATAQLVQFGLIEKVEQRGKVTGYKLNFAIDDNGTPSPTNGGTTTPDKRVHPIKGTTPENGGYPPPINRGTTTPDKRGTSKDTTKNTNTKNKESIAHECATPTKPAKPKKTDLWVQALAMLLAEGVDETVARDFVEVRKQKRLPMTETALMGIKREAAKASLTLAQAVQYATEQGWGSFAAQWLLNRQQVHQPPQAQVVRSNRITHTPEHTTGGEIQW